MIGGDLKVLPKDDRDFKLGALYTLPKLKTLPDKFELDILGVKDQKQSDFCASYASCLVSEMQEKVKLEPSYLFALSKELSGDKDSYGQDLRTIAKAHVKFGTIEERKSPYNVDNRSPEFLRDIANWEGGLRVDALYHKKGSYISAEYLGYDPFDAIRATIYKFRREKRGVFSGVRWSWDSKTEIIDDYKDAGGGHAIAYAGWKGEYLKMWNSYGKDAGRNGYHWVHRKVVNHFVDMYGAFMFSDISKEEAEYYLKSGTKVDMNWVQQLFLAMLNVVK